MKGLNTQQLHLLRAVAVGDVTWRNRSYYLWGNEREVITARMQPLLKRGFVKKGMAAGHTYAARGPVDLTDAGRRVIKR